MTNDRMMVVVVMMIMVEQQKLHSDAVILAQARIYDDVTNACAGWQYGLWIPAFAGMTGYWVKAVIVMAIMPV